ncbi:hypothetical protein D3C73_714000 [compost metagenome]
MRNSFILLLVFAIFCPGMAAAKTKSVELKIDEVTLSYNSQKPEIMDGVVMSPYIPVMKQMKAKYEWSSKNQTLTIEKDKNRLRMTIGSTKALLNGKAITIDAKPRLITGNIYIPVKSIAVAFGADYEVWESSADMTVRISFTDYGKMTRALVNDDYIKVKKLIDQGIDLKHVDKDGENYLHKAAFFSSVEINRLLLEHGVPVNQFDKLDYTPLGEAILASKEEVVRLLAPHTDLSYVSPYTKYSYLDDAKDQVELLKELGMANKLTQAEAIVAYLEEALGVNLPGNSLKSAAQMGQTVTVNTTLSSGKIKTIGITVEKAIRGEQAWKKVAEAGTYNSRPANGKEYVAVLVRVDLDQDSQKYTPNNRDFNLVSEQGEVFYQPYLYLAPEPKFKLYYESNENATGWLVFSVTDNIAMEKLIFSYKGNDSKNLAYFQLQETPEDKQEVDLSQLRLPSNISTTPDVSELKTILDQNFSKLHITTQGDLTFEFKIVRNVSTMAPYDYKIDTLLEFLKYHDLQYSNTISEEQRALIFQQLKDHQEKIGLSLTALYPNVKFTGSYYDSWYKYPYLKVGFESFSLNEWSNYDQPSISTNSYQKTQPSFFRWVH